MNLRRQPARIGARDSTPPLGKLLWRGYYTANPGKGRHPYPRYGPASGMCGTEIAPRAELTIVASNTGGAGSPRRMSKLSERIPLLPELRVAYSRYLMNVCDSAVYSIDECSRIQTQGKRRAKMGPSIHHVHYSNIHQTYKLLWWNYT